MGKARTYVPITGSVLQWAIEESGYEWDEVADYVKVELEELGDWILGEAKPGLTQFRKLATFLKRPSATFLLPKPPVVFRHDVQFRHPVGISSREALNPTERLYLREASRIQRTMAWIRTELAGAQVLLPTFPRYDTGADAEMAGRATRGDLGVNLEMQREWSNEWEALRSWRQLLEHAGILVFSFPMGQESCRGFSIWDEMAPVIAVNSGWSATARIFTMLHEYGHLVTRTSSACVEGGWSVRAGAPGDPIERWCEKFAAAALLPEDGVKQILAERFKWMEGESVETLHQAGAVARTLKVSLRAATLRLITLGLSTWDLYRSIPASSDSKGSSTGGATGRKRPKIRLDEYGAATVAGLFEAVRRDLLGKEEMAGFLDLPAPELDGLQQELGP